MYSIFCKEFYHLYCFSPTFDNYFLVPNLKYWQSPRSPTCLRTPMSADRGVHRQGCPQTGVSADRGVRRQGCPQTGVSADRGVRRQGCPRTGLSAGRSFVLIRNSLTLLDKTPQQCNLNFLTAVDCDGKSLNCLTQSKACAYGMTCV